MHPIHTFSQYTGVKTLFTVHDYCLINVLYHDMTYCFLTISTQHCHICVTCDENILCLLIGITAKYHTSNET